MRSSIFFLFFLVVLDISGFIFRIILAIQYNYKFIDVLGLCLNLK